LANHSAKGAERGRLNEFMSDEGNAAETTSLSWLLVVPIGSQRHLSDPMVGGPSRIGRGCRGSRFRCV